MWAAWPIVLVTVFVWAGALGVAQHAPIDLERAWVDGRPDALARCLIPGETPQDSAFHQRLAALFGRVAEDPLGALLLSRGGSEQVPICLDDRNTGCRGAYACEEGVIVVDERLSENDLTLVTIHELRHLDRAVEGYRVPLEASLDAARTLVCVSEADAEAITTLVAWRMRSAGHSGPWFALLADPRYGDIGAAFEAAMQLGAHELQATRVAFLRWFASPWRVDTYRRSAAMAQLDRIDELHVVPSYLPLPERLFDDFGRLPDLRSYDASPPSGHDGGVGPD